MYRPEVDGLRALAVVPVILFHAGQGPFSGGFAGVDVFFVISGYLITSLIVTDLEAGRFSLVEFYERRARRILPALSFVLLATTLAAYVVVPPALLKTYSESLAAVSVFLSNFYFFLASGYFDPGADESPLLHTWSLAVEEQFYLVFPVLLLLLWGGQRRRLFLVLGTAGLLSLACAQYLSQASLSAGNFYLSPSRAWELLAGAALAFLTPAAGGQRWWREVAAAVGLVLILHAVIAFDERTPFPSLFTLVPVVGSCLVIVGATPQTLVGRLLGLRPVVFIGLLSYSLYLWHQPVFALLRVRHVGEPSPGVFAVAIAAIAILSVLSWRFVERPWRDRARFTRPQVFGAACISIGTFFLAGLVGHSAGGVEERFQVPQYTETMSYSPMRKSCHTSGTDYLKPPQACRYFGKRLTWASLGDSHVVELSYAIAETLQPRDEALLHLSFSGCPPAINFESGIAGCSAWLRESLAYLESHSEIRDVLLGFRHVAYLSGSQLDSYPRLEDQLERRFFAEAYRDRSDADLRALYWEGLGILVARLRGQGKRVHLLFPIPELPMSIQQATLPATVFGTQPLLSLDRAVSTQFFAARNRQVLPRLESLAKAEGVNAVRPFEILCGADFCPMVRDDKALYFDDNHLSLWGSRLVWRHTLAAAQDAANVPGGAALSIPGADRMMGSSR